MDTPARQSDGAGSRFRFPMPDDLFQLRISLLDIEPAIWRRLIVRKDILLPRLHPIIQSVMGWTDSHLHLFKVGDVRFGELEGEYLPGAIDYRAIALHQIVPYRGSNCLYEYDFGDSWEHRIEVEDELALESVTEQVPWCAAGERACPPEDSGGPPGYAHLIAALRDPRHEEHQELRRWAGRRFDPEAFDLERVTAVSADTDHEGDPRWAGVGRPVEPRSSRRAASARRHPSPACSRWTSDPRSGDNSASRPSALTRSPIAAFRRGNRPAEVNTSPPCCSPALSKAPWRGAKSRTFSVTSALPSAAAQRSSSSSLS